MTTSPPCSVVWLVWTCPQLTDQIAGLLTSLKMAKFSHCRTLVLWVKPGGQTDTHVTMATVLTPSGSVSSWLTGEMNLTKGSAEHGGGSKHKRPWRERERELNIYKVFPKGRRNVLRNSGTLPFQLDNVGASFSSSVAVPDAKKKLVLHGWYFSSLQQGLFHYKNITTRNCWVMDSAFVSKFK